MTGPAGYSGKPVFSKLGIKPGMSVHVMGCSGQYDSVVPDHPGRLTQGPAEIVHLFCANRAALEAHVDAALSHVLDGGMLWISWPKKSTAAFQDLTEDDLRASLLPKGWVDVKVCAVDATWSGLKFLRRRT